MQAVRSVVLVAALGLVITACGGDSSAPSTAPVATDPPTSAGTTPGSTTGSTESVPSTSVTDSGPTTTVVEGAAAFDAIDAVDLSGDVGTALDSVGTSQTDLATALAADLTAAGVDLTGVEIWVFSVVGSSAQLLLFDINPNASGLTEDPTGGALFEVLGAAPSLPDPAQTQFSMNYHDSDGQGAFTLTMTLPLQALLDSVASGSDVSSIAKIQILRDGVAQ